MRHILFGGSVDHVEIAILIKSTAFFQTKMQNAYISPLEADRKYFIGFDLQYPDGKKKPTAAQAKDYISGLLPEIDKLGIKNVLCADAEYFKKLTGLTKADDQYGYLVPCKWEGFEHINIMVIPNYQATTYNPAIQGKIDISLAAMKTHVHGDYQEPGKDIIHSAYYPAGPDNIRACLTDLLTYEHLVCDIEARSLEFWNCGVATAGFAWDQHNGVAFGVDREQHAGQVRQDLKFFFENFHGKLTWHGSGFDLKVLIYNLWMKDLGDYKGMLEGLEVMTRCFHDTLLIAYLATNNTVKNTLGLKELSMEYTGNYAEDMTGGSDAIELPALLEYNLKDCLATAYLLNKYGPKMVEDEQQDLYTNLFLPSVKTLLQTELCGIPISMEKVLDAERQLTDLVNKYTKIIMDNPEVKEFHFQQVENLITEMTNKAVKKKYTREDAVIARFEFNPNSDTQLRAFLYDYLGYEVIDLTKVGKQPATGADTLKKLKANAKTPEHKILLDAFVKLGEASIILSTFIPAFKNAQQLPDGSWRLYGNFKLGGTISLRLSSANPNLMNLPSGSTFAKMIKACFISTYQWIFMGSDFDALEDKVNTLQTKDPNKMKIYIDGFDGHCLRAYNYWPHKFPAINPEDPKSINSMKRLFPQDRQNSKAPSFALQYQGTHITLMNNCGFSKREAKSIEKNYHIMYEVADKWAANHIARAKHLGYVPLAFGGRLRTPLLEKSGKRLTYMAQKEGRSAGNALTQSYCILTLRAFNEFMERVWASPYKYDILPAITIHDAIYLVVRNSGKIVEWVNKHLVECMAWNDLKELQHPVIKISSAVDIHYLDWSHPIEIPNGSDAETIKQLCRDFRRNYEVQQWLGTVEV